MGRTAPPAVGVDGWRNSRGTPKVEQLSCGLSPGLRNWATPPLPVAVLAVVALIAEQLEPKLAVVLVKALAVRRRSAAIARRRCAGQCSGWRVLRIVASEVTAETCDADESSDESKELCVAASRSRRAER